MPVWVGYPGELPGKAIVVLPGKGPGNNSVALLDRLRPFERLSDAAPERKRRVRGVLSRRGKSFITGSRERGLIGAVSGKSDTAGRNCPLVGEKGEKIGRRVPVTGTRCSIAGRWLERRWRWARRGPTDHPVTFGALPFRALLLRASLHLGKCGTV